MVRKPVVPPAASPSEADQTTYPRPQEQADPPEKRQTDTGTFPRTEAGEEWHRLAQKMAHDVVSDLWAKADRESKTRPGADILEVREKFNDILVAVIKTSRILAEANQKYTRLVRGDHGVTSAAALTSAYEPSTKATASAPTPQSPHHTERYRQEVKKFEESEPRS